MPTPILFLGDSPTLTTGLSRIMRDLTTRVAAMPEFRVGVLGRGGQYSRHLPFPIYSFPESEQWGERIIESAWNDFAGDERGILMTIWDPTRLSWLALPHLLPDSSLRQFLLNKPFKLWGYFPVDCASICGGVSAMGSAVVKSYDRVLAYSRFGADILSRSVERDIDWAPHGLDLSIFKTRPQKDGREFLQQESGGGFRFFDEDILLGVVAINQPRKDWGLVAAVCSNLKAKYGARFKTWWHTDVLERSYAWNLRALASDFGLGVNVLICAGQEWKDREMSLAYSACNLTLAPGMEGFGYPIAESMACGVPVVTGAQHGGSELVTEAGGIVVKPIADRIEGIHNNLRSVHNPADWTNAAVELIENPRSADDVRTRVLFLDYDKTLWSGVFQKWFMAGLK